MDSDTRFSIPASGGMMLLGGLLLMTPAQFPWQTPVPIFNQVSVKSFSRYAAEATTER
jgi:hypothetical protein